MTCPTNRIMKKSYSKMILGKSNVVQAKICCALNGLRKSINSLTKTANQPHLTISTKLLTISDTWGGDGGILKRNLTNCHRLYLCYEQHQFQSSESEVEEIDFEETPPVNEYKHANFK